MTHFTPMAVDYDDQTERDERSPNGSPFVFRVPFPQSTQLKRPLRPELRRRQWTALQDAGLLLLCAVRGLEVQDPPEPFGEVR